MASRAQTFERTGKPDAEARGPGMCISRFKFRHGSFFALVLALLLAVNQVATVNGTASGT